MKEKKKVLITGITGFVGQNLSSFLIQKEYEIQGISRKEKHDHIAYTSLDIQKWNKAFAIIHLAAKVHDLNGIANDQPYFEANTELTKQLYDQFLTSNCEVFIFVSSVKAVTDHLDDILTEERPTNPSTAYGRSKLEAENYILSLKLPKDKRVYILRPCMIHGAGNKGNLNSFFKLVDKGIPYPFGAFENKRSFLSMDNFSYIIHQLLENKIPSGVYNMADDEPISTNELIYIMSEVIGTKPKIWFIHKGIIKITAELGDLLRLPLNSFKLGKITENFVVSNTKIKTAFNIYTLPLSAKDGLIQTFKSFINKN
jgi:nucleoside-diphosphate-sugar epimerase